MDIHVKCTLHQQDKYDLRQKVESTKSVYQSTNLHFLLRASSRDESHNEDTCHTKNDPTNDVSHSEVTRLKARSRLGMYVRQATVTAWPVTTYSRIR